MVGECYLITLFWVLINNGTWTICPHCWSRTASSFDNWYSRLSISFRAISLRIEVLLIFRPSVYWFWVFALCLIEYILLWRICLHAGFCFNARWYDQARSKGSPRQPCTHSFVSWLKIYLLLNIRHDSFPFECADVLFIQLIYIHHSVTRAPLLHWGLRARLH